MDHLEIARRLIEVENIIREKYPEFDFALILRDNVKKEFSAATGLSKPEMLFMLSDFMTAIINPTKPIIKPSLN